MVFLPALYPSFRRGQTLVELLTALFIIGLVLVGALALTNSNFRLEGIGAMRLTATSLAREGVELARNIRDTNWMKGAPFDSGLVDADHCAVIAASAQMHISHFSFKDCVSVFDASFQLRKLSEGKYGSDASIGEASTFFRLVRFDPICLDGGLETVAEQGDCGVKQKIGVKVKSEVGWNYGGSAMSLAHSEKFYDWR